MFISDLEAFGTGSNNIGSGVFDQSTAEVDLTHFDMYTITHGTNIQCTKNSVKTLFPECEKMIKIHDLCGDNVVETIYNQFKHVKQTYKLEEILPKSKDLFEICKAIQKINKDGDINKFLQSHNIRKSDAHTNNYYKIVREKMNLYDYEFINIDDSIIVIEEKRAVNWFLSYYIDLAKYKAKKTVRIYDKKRKNVFQSYMTYNEILNKHPIPDFIYIYNKNHIYKPKQVEQEIYIDTMYNLFTIKQDDNGNNVAT